MDSPHSFHSVWLSGTTCFHGAKRFIHWTSDDDRFVVLKHEGHSEYMGRFSNTAWCGTYYVLVDLKHPPRNSTMSGCLGAGCWKVEGRWLKRHWKELEEKVAEIRKAKP